MNIKQRGFSLIELFVAVTVGLILLAGALQIFIYVKATYSLNNDSTQLQENARFVNQYLSRVIRHAGYRSPPTPNTTSFPTLSTVFSSPYVSGIENSGTNNSDSLTVRFQGNSDGLTRDCLNRVVGNNVISTNIFSVSNNYELQCQSSTSDGSLATITQIIMPNVENFQILYGEDLDGNGTADRYVPANHPNLNLSRVISLRLSYLIRSANNYDPVSQARTYYLIGQTYTTTADKYLRQSISFTITLRNLLTQSV